MSAPDYEYLDQQTDILLTENRMQHDRIAALEAQNRALREALTMAKKEIIDSGNWGARDYKWPEVTRKIDAALAATEENRE